jgi:hypothetical protein
MTTSLSPSQAPLGSLTLAASVVIQQDVAWWAGAEVCARLIHTLVLAEELGEAALVHIWWWDGDKLYLLFIIRLSGSGNLAVIYFNSQILLIDIMKLLIHFLNTSGDKELFTY